MLSGGGRFCFAPGEKWPSSTHHGTAQHGSPLVRAGLGDPAVPGRFPPWRLALYHYEAMEAGLCTGRQVTAPEGPSQAARSLAKAILHVAGSKETGLCMALILCSCSVPQATPKDHWGSCGWAQGRVEEGRIFSQELQFVPLFLAGKPATGSTRLAPVRACCCGHTTAQLPLEGSWFVKPL